MQHAEEFTNCPECGHQIRVDRRFVTWCDKCDWNVDPTPSEDHTPRWRLRLEHRLAESLYRELETGTIHRPGWDAARIGAQLLSALILLLPLIAFLAGVALIVFYRPLWLSGMLALLAFGLAFLSIHAPHGCRRTCNRCRATKPPPCTPYSTNWPTPSVPGG